MPEIVPQPYAQCTHRKSNGSMKKNRFPYLQHADIVAVMLAVMYNPKITAKTRNAGRQKMPATRESASDSTKASGTR